MVIGNIIWFGLNWSSLVRFVFDKFYFGWQSLVSLSLFGLNESKFQSTNQ